MTSDIIEYLDKGTVIVSRQLSDLVYSLYQDFDKEDTHPSDPTDNYVRYGVRWGLTNCKNKGMIKNLSRGLWVRV